MSGRRTLARWSATLLALACGCGGEAPAPEPASEATTTASAAEARNDPPRIDRVQIRPDDVEPGGTVTVDVSASDPNGDPLELSYRWSIDGERVSHGEPLMRIPESAARARIEVAVTAADGKGGSSRASAQLDVANRAPRVTNLMIEPGREIRTTDVLSTSFRGDDPDGDPIEFQHTWLVDGRPLAVSARKLSGAQLQRDSVIEVQVRASDGDLESPVVKSPPIRVVNTPPVIVSTPTGFDASGAFVYRVKVSDEDGDRLFRYRLVQGPEGMSIDWLNGRMRWDPERQQTGKHEVAIEVDDQHGGVATQNFSLEVDFGKPGPAPASPAS